MGGILGDVLGYIGAGRAAKSVSTANKDAENAIGNATTAATGGVQSSLGKSYNDVGAAGANVNQAASDANAGLQSTRNDINGNLSGYMASGAQGNQQLQSYAASNPQFNFNLQDYLNGPAMQFQMQQGQDAITNRASAMGLSQGGNVLKDLTTFGQGLGATYYGQAFNQAQQQFQTNQNATMQNIGALLGAGQFGTQQYDASNAALSGQQSSNTTGAASTNAGLQEYLAGLGLQGNIASGQMSMQGAKIAGDYGVGAGQANATGIMNQTAALSSGIGDILSGAIGGIGGIPIPGGGTSTIAGLFGGH